MRRVSKLFSPAVSRTSHLLPENNRFHVGERQHAYQKGSLFPWKSADEFRRHLEQSIVHRSGEMVIIDKPYGVPTHQSKASASTSGWSHHHLAPFSIQDCLPSLAKSIGVPTLQIVQRAERFTSGLLMLGTSYEAVKNIQKAIRRTKNMGIRPFTYRLLTCGIPHPLFYEGNIGLEMVENETGKHPVVKLKFSNNEVKQDFVKKVSSQYRVISQNMRYKAALVDMEVTTNEWYFVRVYSVFRSAAILGDDLHASRMKYVFGKPILISVHNAASCNPTILQPQVCSALKLSRKDSNHVPAHIHLHKLSLMDKKHNVTSFTVAPPRYFTWSCEQLGLNFVDRQSKNSRTELCTTNGDSL